MSDVDTTNSDQLKVGDEVEFAISHNSRSGKFSAIKIRKLLAGSSTSASLTTQNSSTAFSTSNSQAKSSSSQLVTELEKRPERLITKLKTANIDDKSGKQLILIRQPNNPVSKVGSFGRQLRERLPGSLIPINASTSSLTALASEKPVFELEPGQSQDEGMSKSPVNNSSSFLELLEAAGSAVVSSSNDTV